MVIKIKDRIIGKGHPLFFIAEAGVNHNGSLDLALKLVDIAVDAGADAIKFQTFKTEKIITPNAPKSTYHVQTTGTDEKQSWFELLKSQELDEKMHVELINYCQQKRIIFLSTPYDTESADMLDKFGVPAFKIASTDTNNIPFLKYLARKKRPMILSSAMSTMSEVRESIKSIRDEGLEEIAMLQCTGNYPAKLEDSHLNVISTFAKQLKCVIGYSDHTQELINPIAATAMGASIYEKHFTIDKSLPGPDHRMALEPSELKETIIAIRSTEKAMGTFRKVVLESEKENRIKLRKSLVADADIAKGSVICGDMIALKRPGNGLSPSFLPKLIGKKAISDISKNTIIKKNMFS